MALITLPYVFAPNTRARASEVNANFDAIVQTINGGLEAVNLANGAVTENKIADDAVTSIKVAPGLDVTRLADGSVDNATFQHLSGVTGAIQTQLDGKQATITGAATTILTNDLMANRALVSTATGKVSASTVTSTELGYLSGVTSSIQTQLNGKAPSSHTHGAGDIVSGTLSVARGGTGLSAYTTGNYIRASGSSSLEQRTPTQVRSDIGAAASSHTHSTGDLTSGILPVVRGGTGLGGLITGNFIRAANGGSFEQRTPGQVLSDIGAASSSHLHDNRYVRHDSVGVGLNSTQRGNARGNIFAMPAGADVSYAGTLSTSVSENGGTYTIPSGAHVMWVDHPTGNMELQLNEGGGVWISLGSARHWPLVISDGSNLRVRNGSSESRTLKRRAIV